MLSCMTLIIIRRVSMYLVQFRSVSGGGRSIRYTLFVASHVVYVVIHSSVTTLPGHELPRPGGPLVVAFRFQVGEVRVQLMWVHHVVVHLLVGMWMHTHTSIHACHLMLLLPLHPPVLEPDLDLSLC